MMNKKITKTIAGFLLLALLFVFSCQEKAGSDKLDTILEGKATVYVDESILPIVEDMEAVFETQYKAFGASVWKWGFELDV